MLELPERATALISFHPQCLYPRNRESWAEVDALKICPGDPQTHFLPPPPGGCVSIAASAREKWSTDLGQLLFFTQHESSSADTSIGRICTHCPECNLNLLPALGSEIGISAFQLPFPWHTGCCCTQTGMQSWQDWHPGILSFPGTYN